MSGDARWNSVEQLFARVLDEPAEGRDAFIHAACGPDHVLRDELLSLLRAHDEAGEFLEHPPLLDSHTPLAVPALTPGTRLGSFEIQARLGTGGMGTVYCARDLRLDRSVALKLLTPRAGLAGTQRERLEREARAISRLAHPHICTLYDIGHVDAPAGDGTTVDFLVMELLRGETLDVVLAGGPLPVPTAVRYAAQIADALACAHAEGIVHRDLKPQNVMVTAGGVKLLDFGLASVSASDLSERTLTHPGLMVGTMPYMSPEQIEGRQVDARSDLFSLGVVLHEMLAGSPAFERAGALETLQAVLHDQPPPLPGHVHAPLAAVVAHCLEKDRERRMQSARDVMIALSALAVASDVGRPAPKRVWLRIGAGALAVAALGAGAAIIAATGRWSAVRQRAVPFATEAAPEMQAAWSPDGRSVAYVRIGPTGAPQLVVRRTDSTVATPLATSESNVWHPFWARDGRRIYFGQGELRSVSVSDGSTRVEVPDAIASDVSPDGRTLAVWRMTVENGLRMWTLWFGADAASLRRYEAAPVFRNGTVPTVVRFSPDGSKILLWVAGEKPSIGLMPFPPRPSDPPKRVFADSVGEVAGADWMPDSLHVVLSVNGGLWIGDIETGEVRTLLTSTASLVWPVVSPAGDRLLFTEDRSDLDVVQLSLSGGPRSVVVGSIRNDGSATWSPDGRRLAYVTDRRGSDEVWLRTGDESSDRPFLTARDFPGPRFGRIMSVRYSPDGERMSLATLSSEPGGPFLVRLWIVPARGGTPRLLESEHAHAQRATWSPDGRELAVKDSPDDSVWALDVDSSRPPRRILKRPDVHVWHLEWSPTGDLIAGVGLIDPGRVPRTVVFAPDGTGLRTFPELSQVALLWSRDGRTLYGVTDIDGSTVLRALDVASGQVRTVANYGARLALTEPINDSLQFTLTPDGTGFVATVYNNRSDIWLLDGLSAPAQRRWSVW